MKSIPQAVSAIAILLLASTYVSAAEIRKDEFTHFYSGLAHDTSDLKFQIGDFPERFLPVEDQADLEIKIHLDHDVEVDISDLLITKNKGRRVVDSVKKHKSKNPLITLLNKGDKSTVKVAEKNIEIVSQDRAQIESEIEFEKGVVKLRASGNKVKAFEGEQCDIHNIYFEIGKSELPEAFKGHLDESLAKCDRQNNSFAVYGFTCDLGDKKSNHKLALKRAKSVANYLKMKGFKVPVVDGRGEEAMSSKNLSDRHINRRVEVHSIRN